jgi:hemolysin activation/secretion protein
MTPYPSVKSASPSRRLAVVAAGLLLTAAVATAADAPVLTEATNTRYEIRLGAFALSDINTSLRLDGSNGSIGSDIGVADRLGGDTKLNVFRADGSMVISGNHGIEFSWYDLNVRGDKVIDTSINWGDTVYPVNAEIKSQFRTNVYRLAYTYTFHRDQRHEFSGLLGVHLMNFQTSLEAVNLGKAERVSATAPLPSFGLAWRARWTERFSTRASLQYFGISLEEGKYSGHFTDALATAEYRFSKSWGVGGGYNRFDLSGAFKPGKLKLTMDFTYNGFLLYAFARF